MSRRSRPGPGGLVLVPDVLLGSRRSFQVSGSIVRVPGRSRRGSGGLFMVLEVSSGFLGPHKGSGGLVRFFLF